MEKIEFVEIVWTAPAVLECYLNVCARPPKLL